METVPSPTSGKRRAKFIAGGVLIALTLVGLTVWAMARPGSTAYYKTTTEVYALGASGPTEDIRVNGTVVPGSIEHDGLITTFALTDGTTEVTVETDQPLPDTFKEESDVVARGRFDG